MPALRILHVVTLVSPDGAYGGPVRVATLQCEALRRRGHTVHITAAATGFAELPTAVGTIDAHLFAGHMVVPGVGFAGLCAPGMLPWLRRNRDAFDVAHVHLARDLVSLPAARMWAAWHLPLVVQTHGMIDASSRLLAGPVDALLTRPVLRAAGRTLYLTEGERSDLSTAAGGRARLDPLPNGVPTPDDSADSDEPVGVPEVLFLARLHPRKRAPLFVEMAARLIDRGVTARFTLVGPDEGDGPRVQQLIEDSGHADRIGWMGALGPDETLERMRRAAVYVLPAVGEPFPMTVLEAMSIGRPVVVTDDCGLAPLVASSSSGISVCPDDLTGLADAVTRLLQDPVARHRMARNARNTARTELSIDPVIARLETMYQEVAAT
ncbi:MAG: glycosyltransferase [Aeromicrobium sp.]